MRRINSTGSAHNVQVRPRPPASTRALSPRRIWAALLAAMLLAGLALWSTPADGGEPAEPVWSADMTVVEYSSVSMGAASADLFSNVGGSGNLQIKSLWSHIPGRDLRLAFDEGVPNAADYTLQVGSLSLEFPEDSSGASSFKWNDVDVDWEDGQLIRARIVPTSDSEAQQTENTPATGVPTISGTAQVGETLSADTSGITDEDGLDSVSYHYQWIRIDANIADATDSTYTLTDDDQGKTIKLKVTFIDDKGNSETLTIVAAAEVSEKPQFLVSNLGVNVAAGMMRPLSAARSAFAQAFTTGTKTGGYALGSVGIQVSQFSDASTVGDHLQVTINGVASGSEPGVSHCTLTNPTSFSTPGVIAFEAPTGAGSCPRLATETTYFIVIEWVDPSGTDSFALIPQTYPTEETAATEEDPGGAEGWSIADVSYYLAVSSDARTWTAYDETASFKIELKEAAVAAAEANSPAAGAPTISGTAQVGQTLTADTSAIADADGLTDVSYSYQWMAGGLDIDGATGSSYTLTSSEQGQTVTVRVTFTDDADNTESLTSVATETVAAKPPNTAPAGLPTISGTPEVEQTLTADISGIADADGLTNVSYSYRWMAGGTDIDGAAGSSYTLISSEQGQTIQVRVTFTDDDDNEESLTSEATVAVAAKPTSEPLALPTISGTPQVEQTLTADTSGIADAGGLENVSYSYQWMAGGSDIDGATGSSYTLTSSEQGQTIQVRVTFTDDEENEESLTSVATEAVAAKANTAPTGLPAISGTPQVEQTLTADITGIADADGLDDVSYIYQWLTGGTDIDGATGSSYTLTSSEQGRTVQVRVTFTDDADNEDSLTSVATETVAAKANTAPTGLPTISGTPQVEQTLTADTSAIDDADGLDDVSYRYQWMAGGSAIDGATGSSYTLTSSEQGQTVQVRVTFTDDADNAETLTSEATEAVAHAPSPPTASLPLTASLENAAASHNGTDVFTFEIRFSEQFGLSYKTLRDDAFTEVGGEVKKAQRKDSDSNTPNTWWLITVEPDGNGDVTITLPATTDCDADGAICTDDGRKLSNRLNIAVSGPGQE